jgi:hypothetical protein
VTVFENRVLRRIFGPGREGGREGGRKRQKAEEDCIMRSFII